jgi:phospholipase/carboxylesterase
MIKYTKTVHLDNIELNPDQSPIGSVLWLHGLGADGHDFVPIVPELHLPMQCPLRFIFPHAPLQPVTRNNGYVMRAWFDMAEIAIDMHVDEKGIARSVALINERIEQELNRGISPSHIVLAGFSQGGVIALHAGLRYPQKLGGIISLSSALPALDIVLKEKNPSNTQTPIFIAHGTNDDVLPIDFGKMSAQQLKNHGYSITWQEYNMGHSVCSQEIHDLSQWLSYLVFQN